MYFTYVLESNQGHHWYFGVTNNITRRLYEHNAGKSTHTNKYKPWHLRFCATFRNDVTQKHLKSILNHTQVEPG